MHLGVLITVVAPRLRNTTGAFALHCQCDVVSVNDKRLHYKNLDHEIHTYYTLQTPSICGSDIITHTMHNQWKRQATSLPSGLLIYAPVPTFKYNYYYTSLEWNVFRSF